MIQIEIAGARVSEIAAEKYQLDTLDLKVNVHTLVLL
jgi:hypothetical protein